MKKQTLGRSASGYARWLIEQLHILEEKIQTGSWEIVSSSVETYSNAHEIHTVITVLQKGDERATNNEEPEPEPVTQKANSAEDSTNVTAEIQPAEFPCAIGKPKKIYPTEAERLEYLQADTPVRAKFRDLVSMLPEDMKMIAKAAGKSVAGISAILGLHTPCKHATAQLIANAAVSCGYGITADQICDGYDSRSRYMGRTPKSKWQKTYAAENKDVRRNHEQKYAARVEEGTLTADEAHKLDTLTKCVRPFDRPTRLYPERSEVPATKRLAVALPWEKQKKMAALSGMGLNTIYAMMHMRKHVSARAARALCQAAAACGIELREEDLTVPQKSLNPLVGW